MLNNIVSDNLELILESIVLIEKRFSTIDAPDEFISSPDGVLILDAISMRLQVIGELTRKIYKTEASLLE